MADKRMIYIINYRKDREDSVKTNITDILDKAGLEYKVLRNEEIVSNGLKNGAAARNYCIRDAQAKGIRFVHLMEDDLMLKDPSYFKTNEKLMALLKIPYIFNGATAKTNYVLRLVIPRLIQETPWDAPLDKIVWYSYEAKEYTGIDLDNSDQNTLMYDEKYDYYYFAHNLWRRKYVDGSVKFLNFYPSVNNELDYIERNPDIKTHVTPEIMKKARQEVTDADIKWEPDVSIDAVMVYTIKATGLA